MLLSDLIIRTANSGLALQRDDGSFPSGTNGPYGDKETPVRNTSHWVITLIKAYEYSSDDRFLSAACQAVKYLCSSFARPDGVAFYHRKGDRFEGQDRTNGLIGQAWTIEAIAIATEYVKCEKASRIAAETFQAHPFNHSVGLWKKIDIDGRIIDYGSVFNQHLWFAMSGLLLLNKSSSIRPDIAESITNKIDIFLSNLDSIISVLPNGLIVHPLLPIRPFFRNMKCNTDLQKSILKKWRYILLKKPINTIQNQSFGSVFLKSKPYHSFNLYALAIIYQIKQEIGFWKSKKHKKILAYSKRDDYLQGLKKSDYGYKYNPPGFELTYAWYVFNGELTAKSRDLLNDQLKYSYDTSSNLLIRNSNHEQTSAARFYELTRLPDVEVSL